MGRIGELKYEEMTPEQRAVADKILASPRKTIELPHHAWLRNPRLADLTQQLGTFMRYEILEPRWRELCILIVGRHWDCELEWYFHRAPAEAAGLDAGLLDDLAAGRRPDFGREEDAAIFDFLTELLNGHAVSDATYARALQVLGEKQIIELIGLSGYYVTVAMLLKTFAWELPDGAQPQLQGI